MFDQLDGFIRHDNAGVVERILNPLSQLFAHGDVYALDFLSPLRGSLTL
jgi:hypothetical protein